MTTEEHPEPETREEPIPRGQHFFDNLLWLLLISLLISLIIYNAWGIFELMNVPPLGN
ncbi:MAG TPA: hypothetical protein VMN57_16685 [Anaerolineales bacterium]|nr:hypothetical protein [Anaerolineales bacterium]